MKISPKVILIILVAVCFVVLKDNSTYAYYTSYISAVSNEVEIKFYKGLNTQVSCELIDKNKAKVKLVNNGEIECKAKIKLILPVDVTYTILDSNWTTEKDDWMVYNNVLKVGETVELDINLNIPESKDYKFNINVIQETNLITEYDEPESYIPSDKNGFSAEINNSMAASLFDGYMLIAKDREAGRWDVCTGPLKVGKKYANNLRAYNPKNALTQHTKATIEVYSIDEQGNKRVDVPLDVINVEYGNEWLISNSKTTMDRRVLVYSKAIEGGEYSTEILKGITVDKKVLGAKTIETRKENGGTIRTMTYDYDGVKLKFDVTIDSVQARLDEDAIRGAWGMRAEVSPDDRTILSVE